jgi:hypothetical protein
MNYSPDIPEPPTQSEVVPETSDAPEPPTQSEVVPETSDAPEPPTQSEVVPETSDTPEPITDFLCPPEWPVSIIYTLFRCFSKRILINTVFGRSHFDVLFGYIFTIDGRACAGIYNEDDPEMGVFDEYSYNNEIDHPDIVYCRCLPDSILDRYRDE